MTYYLHMFRDFLASVHPQAPGLALMLSVWGIMWAVRKWRPTLWAAIAKWGPEGSTLQHAIQALPSVVVGAAMAAMSSGGDMVQAAHDAVFAFGAPFLHHLLKNAPGPYRGSTKVPDGPTSRRELFGSNEDEDS